MINDIYSNEPTGIQYVKIKIEDVICMAVVYGLPDIDGSNQR